MISRFHFSELFFLLMVSIYLPPYAQMHGQEDTDGYCPMCGRPWDGSNYFNPTIPDRLPAPQDSQWLNRLDGIMAQERLSKAQYRKDAQKYRLRMPYRMVIPQEENHIEWISGLYTAFGMQVPDSIPPIKETSNGRDALRLGMKLEEELIPGYEWLIQNAGNETIRRILGDILYQTRMHFTMFQHALSMGGMMGARTNGRSEAQMDWDHMNWGWGGAVMMLFLIALIAAAIYWLIRSARRNGNQPSQPESAIDVLKKRYARGEISKEQYEQMKKDLF